MFISKHENVTANAAVHAVSTSNTSELESALGGKSIEATKRD